ncbi:MAG: hypothetical protein WC657_01670 [Candidatus Paceibacterota bacterium]|jgi:hypothetical protein
MSKVSPVTPDDIAKGKENAFPYAVFEAFNQLILEHFSRGTATFKQEEVLTLLKNKGLNREEIFKRGWLDVEEVYRAVGWVVLYDKPGYNESYPATFTFKRSQ